MVKHHSNKKTVNDSESNAPISSFLFYDLHTDMYYDLVILKQM